MMEQEMIMAQSSSINGSHTQIMPAPGMPAPLRMPNVPGLPPGLSKEDFDKLPTEQKLIIQ